MGRGRRLLDPLEILLESVDALAATRRELTRRAEHWAGDMLGRRHPGAGWCAGMTTELLVEQPDRVLETLTTVLTR